VKQNRHLNLSVPLDGVTAELVHPGVEVATKRPVDVAVANEMVGPHPEITAGEEPLATVPQPVHLVFERLMPGSSSA
jgi:hypothetical protein